MSLSGVRNLSAMLKGRPLWFRTVAMPKSIFLVGRCNLCWTVTKQSTPDQPAATCSISGANPVAKCMVHHFWVFVSRCSGRGPVRAGGALVRRRKHRGPLRLRCQLRLCRRPGPLVVSR